ncbi:MAG: hypothetical protein FWD25_13510 [Clostridia bacterium]|nr:hypothetical protein [Clostridia bacterium]
MIIPAIDLTGFVNFFSNPIVSLTFWALASLAWKYIRPHVDPKYQPYVDNILDGLVWGAELKYNAKQGTEKMKEVQAGLAHFGIKAPVSVIEAAVARMHEEQKETEKLEAAARRGKNKAPVRAPTALAEMQSFL